LIEGTGEYEERRLNHSDGEAEQFYRDLQLRGVHVRVGMEATGYSRWFERLLAELGLEVWIGDPAEIKAKRPGTGRNFQRVYSFNYPRGWGHALRADRFDLGPIERLVLSDRFAWVRKLAELGKPVILIHLGFLACDEIQVD
jgi:hypothetical protein